MVRRIQLEINLNTGTTVQQVRTVTEQFEQLQEEMRSLEIVSQQLGTNVIQTEQLLEGLGISAEIASSAITGLILEQQGLRQAGETIANLGLNEGQGNILADVLGDPDSISAYIQQLNSLESNLEDVFEVAKLTGSSINEAEQFIAGLGLSASDTARALRSVQTSRSVGADRDTQRQYARSQGVDLDPTQLEVINSALGGAQQNATSLFDRLLKLSFGFNQVTQAAQGLAVAGQAAYGALIQSNEQLRQEILSTQASLAATSEVSLGGEIIGDPTEAILALEAPIKKAIENIRRDSLQLIGITSAELVPLFQIISTNSQQIANQSKEFADPIEAASKLTISFAASLGTLSIPLYAAREEITSILQGTVSVDSQLAKSLGITNEQVRNWKQQGTLVDELQKKLNPLVEGNALAARSISGISSNLEEVFQIITREAGEPIYEQIVNDLERVYKFVQDNQEAIKENVNIAVEFLQSVIVTTVAAVEQIIKNLEPGLELIGRLLKTAAEEGSELLIASLQTLFTTVNLLLSALNPLLTIVNDVFKVLDEFGLTEVIVQAGLVYLALDKIAVLLKVELLKSLIAIARQLAAGTIPGLLAAQGAVSGVGTAFAALPAKIAAASASLQAFIATNAGLIGSLAAVGAAIALTFALYQGNILEDTNETIDILGKTTGTLGDETFKYATKLKELNELEKKNGALTNEQQQQRTNLIAIARSQIEANNQQIATLKGVKTQNDSIKALIQQLEISNSVLEKQSQTIKVQSPLLKEQGKAYDLIRDKVRGYLETIKSGRGDIAAISEQASEAISLIGQQVDAGVISTRDALSQLNVIATNTKLNSEQQLEAQKAIFTALTKDVEKFNEDLKVLENDRLIDLQKLLNAQLITEGEYNEKKAQITTIRIKEELKAETERLESLKSLDLEPEEKQAEIRKAIAKTTELQLQLLQQEKAERESLIALVKEREELAVAAIKRETSQIVSGLKQQQDAYDKLNQGLNRQKTAQDVILRNLGTQNRLINSIAEVEQARRNLTNVEGDIEANRLQKVIELRKKLNSGELKTDRERREVIVELQRLRGFNSRSDRDLENDLKRLEDARFKRQVEAQKAEEVRARVLLELELKKNEASAARAVTEAKIALNQAKQAELSARITANQSIDNAAQAQGELNTAIATEDPEQIANAKDKFKLAREEYQRTQEAIPLAQEAVTLAADSVTEAEKQAGIQAKIAENSRLALGLQEQAANAQLEAEARARGQAAALKEGADQAVRLATALNSIRNPVKSQKVELGENPGDAGIKDGKIVTVEGRFKGGFMSEGTPYVVGEGAGGRFLPGISEIIVPNVDSYAIASSKATEIFNQGKLNQIVNNSYVTAPVVQSNRQLLDAVNGLRTDIKTLETGSVTKIEGTQIINQLTRADNKQEAMRFARDLADEISKLGDR